MKKPEYVPNAARAIVSGKYAVIIEGSRTVIERQSGEPLREGWKIEPTKKQKAEKLFK